MKKKIYLIALFLFLGMIGFVSYYILPQVNPHHKITTDFARVESELIYARDYVTKIEDIQENIKQAKKRNIKVSIAGKKYSGGGHTFTENGLIIDMSDMNKVLDYQPINKKITVESGITWGEIQNIINTDNLSIKVMQSSNIFSIGGSLSSNIHGRDPRFGTIIDTIESFRLITAEGEILDISKEKNSELFGAVIGGFGLFGVVTDVTLLLTDNEIYQKYSKEINYKNYGEYVNKNIVGNPKLGLHYGRFSIVPGNNFLKEFFITDYIRVKDHEIDTALHSEKNILRNRFFFNISRDFQWAKFIRWELQKYLLDNPKKIEVISRNNAMNPPIKFISYYNKDRTDILQEYFVPVNNFTKFIDDLRSVMIENDVNLLSITTRYISKGEKVILNYNSTDMIAVVLYLNVGLDEASQENVTNYTQELIDIVHKLKGRYYLVYQNYATREQMYKIYDNVYRFITIKKKYDPNGLFSNKFSEKYNLQ